VAAFCGYIEPFQQDAGSRPAACGHRVSLLAQVRAETRGASEGGIERFLEGFPRRYLAVHTPAEIAEHFLLYQKLKGQPIQTSIKATRHGFSLAVITADRPALFAKIAGVLAGWGMNIVKADAFANAANVVLDTFQFVEFASDAGTESQ